LKLLRVDTLQEARDKLLEAAACIKPASALIPLQEALGRTLAADLEATESVPGFRKSTVDGYAVFAQDTAGASDSIPAFLFYVGEVEMGKKPSDPIAPGQCVYVPTGGMLPEGANAMVMVEHSEPFGEGQVAIYSAVSQGRNVMEIGDDIHKGAIYLHKGKPIRPQEIGVLASMGMTKVPVFRPWRVTILSTGDELVPADQSVLAGQTRDSNSHTTAAQCKKYGLEVVTQRILADEEETIREAILQAKERSDLLIISGGSSQGKKDMTSTLLNELSDPGVFTHGIAIKPGKPTILGRDKTSRTLLVGLPGHPAAAMVIFELLIGWLWQKMTDTQPPRKIMATMDTNVQGGSGRSLCLLLELSEGQTDLMATPVLGSSGIMTSLSRADGYTLLGVNQEGLNAGDRVQVTLL
jgi:molybdopterin molybdotransferase